MSGGSLAIIQAPNGGISFGGATTWAAASLVAINAGGTLMYTFSTTEAISLVGSARYYLMALGATTVAGKLTGLSSGG